jgi:hypothetical protein
MTHYVFSVCYSLHCRCLVTSSNSGRSSASGFTSSQAGGHLTFTNSSLTNSLLSLSLMLRSTVSRPVCIEIKHPSGAYDQIFITVRQLRVCWFGAPSLMRGRVCRLQSLLVLVSAVIFGSESRRTRGHILLSHFRDFPFRRPLRLAGSRWRYSTPPPHGSVSLDWFEFTIELPFITSTQTEQRSPPARVPLLFFMNALCRKLYFNSEATVWFSKCLQLSVSESMETVFHN